LTLRAERRLSRTSDTGRHVQGYGIRFGYWPCMRATFVELSVGRHRIAAWVAR
jgi:hypothetical protein